MKFILGFAHHQAAEQHYHPGPRSASVITIKEDRTDEIRSWFLYQLASPQKIPDEELQKVSDFPFVTPSFLDDGRDGSTLKTKNNVLLNEWECFPDFFGYTYCIQFY